MSAPANRWRYRCFFSVIAMLTAITPSAYAQNDRDKLQPPVQERPTNEPDPFKIGAIAGVGFPRTLAVEGLVKLVDRVAIGAEYGVMPQVNLFGVDARLTSFAGDARLFPFGGPIFVGLRAGHQHLAADTQVTLVGQNYAGSVAVNSWYVNPRIGLLWTAHSGLTIGTEAGIQIPFGVDVESHLPPEVDRSAVVSVADAVGRQVIPTVDLLRIGYVR
jgi:hypothetical protein